MKSERTCARIGCDQPLPPTGKPGRPRLYCSVACSRKANWGAWRRRVVLGAMVEQLAAQTINDETKEN